METMVLLSEEHLLLMEKVSLDITQLMTYQSEETLKKPSGKQCLDKFFTIK